MLVAQVRYTILVLSSCVNACQKFCGCCTSQEKVYESARDKGALGMAYESFGYPLNSYYDFCAERYYTMQGNRNMEKGKQTRYRCHDVNNGDVFKIDIEDFEEFVVV